MKEEILEERRTQAKALRLQCVLQFQMRERYRHMQTMKSYTTKNSYDLQVILTELPGWVGDRQTHYTWILVSTIQIQGASQVALG